jgi:hypothetical protein
MTGFDPARLRRLGAVMARHVERDTVGTSWGNDPTERLVGIVLTTDIFTGAFPPPAAIQDFWTSVYAAIDD